MIDDKIYWYLRINDFWITTRLSHCIAHCCQINHCRHPGEILHQHPGRPKCNFPTRTPVLDPFNQGFDIARCIFTTTFKSKYIFEQYLERIRQALEATPALIRQPVQIEVMIFLAAYLQHIQGIETIASCFHD